MWSGRDCYENYEFAIKNQKFSSEATMQIWKVMNWSGEVHTEIELHFYISYALGNKEDFFPIRYLIISIKINILAKLQLSAQIKIGKHMYINFLIT